MANRAWGRKVALLVGLLALSVVIALFTVKRLALEYHCWRLRGAQSIDQAQPWFDKIIDGQAPGAGAVIASKLGARDPTLTFWIFFECKQTMADYDSPHDFFPHRLGRLLPLIRDLGRRLEKDEDLLAAWAHFVRWCGSYELLDELSPAQKRPGLAEMLLAEFQLPRTREELERLDEREEFDLRRQVWTWLQGKSETLRFDPRLGRCVPRLEGEEPSPVDIPENPLPGWHGPVPRIAPPGLSKPQSRL